MIVKLFSKIKNILFDEEEVEVPVLTKEEPKKEKTEELVVSKKEVNYEKEYNERELFNSPQTFNFPAYEETKELKREKEEPKEEVRSSRSLNILEYEKRQKKDKPAIFKKEEKTDSKPFKPSPVISPVYGIIHNSEDIKTIKSSATPKPRTTGPIDVDAIRKKAYGTLEDEIVSTLERPLESFYEKEVTKTIDELLNDNIDEEDEPIRNKLDLLDEIEQELDNIPKRETKINPDDTIESDLFNLIDSMYEKKEEKD